MCFGSSKGTIHSFFIKVNSDAVEFEYHEEKKTNLHESSNVIVDKDVSQAKDAILFEKEFKQLEGKIKVLKKPQEQYLRKESESDEETNLNSEH